MKIWMEKQRDHNLFIQNPKTLYTVLFPYSSSLKSPGTLSFTRTKDWGKNLAMVCSPENNQGAFNEWKEFQLKVRLKTTMDNHRINQFIGIYLLAKYSFPLQKCFYPKSRILHSTSDELHMPNDENILKITELMSWVWCCILEASGIFHQPSYLPCKTSQNEIIQLLAAKVKEKIAAFLNSTRHYAVIQDHVSVASQMEKMTLMVHFLTANEVEISEQWRSPESILSNAFILTIFQNMVWWMCFLKC